MATNTPTGTGGGTPPTKTKRVSRAKMQPTRSVGTQTHMTTYTNARAAALTSVADNNLTTARFNRTINDEVFDIIIARMTAGEMCKHVCEQLGVSTGYLYVCLSKNMDWHERWCRASEAATHTLVDSLLENAMNEELSAETRKLVADAIKFIAKTRNRRDYGERPLLNAEKISITLSQDDLKYG